MSKTTAQAELEETKAILEALDVYATTEMPDDIVFKTYSKPKFLVNALVQVLVSKGLLSIEDVNRILKIN